MTSPETVPGIGRKPPVIAITSGEPAGIGPELCAHLAEKVFPARLVILGDRGLVTERAARIGKPVRFTDYRPDASPPPGSLEILHLPLGKAAEPGKLDISNGPYVLHLLDRALQGCTSGEFAAMVTCPVHKGIIADAGFPFTGHTEYLAEKTSTPRVVMLLAGGGLRVALATTHLPLKDVADAITPAELETTLRIMHRDFREKFGFSDPRILVSGLNPHAGEGGHLGREEIEVITPVLEKLRAEGMKLIGPLPADTLFTPPQLARGDGVLAMYHDQGLAVLKYASFGGGVNITLGLPIVRTSVDHGTALDLAGTGKADPGSLFTAVDSALDICRRRAEAPV